MSFSITVNIDGVNFNLDITNMTAEVASGEYVGHLAIPGSVDYQDGTFQVTSIERNAFSICQNIQSISLPPTITQIRPSAFNGCSKLDYVRISDLSKWCNIDFGSLSSNPLYKADHFYLGDDEIVELTIPSDVSVISAFAFSNCRSLQRLYLPETLKEVGYESFIGCSNLIEVTVSKNVSKFGNSAFGACDKLQALHISDLEAWCKSMFVNYISNPLYCAHHIYLNGEEITDLKIPESISSISDYAFIGGQYIKSVDMHDRIEKIGDGTFMLCSGIELVTLPNSITTIGSEAFRGTGLVTIDVPESVETIGVGCFSGCKRMTSAVIHGNVSNLNERLFSSCPLLKNVDFLGKVFSIGNEAFMNCSDLELFSIPDSVKSIGSKAFWGCTNLLKINDGVSLEAIGDEAFRGCIKLDSLSLPSNVVSVGKRAFQECTGMESVSLPKYITEIGGSAFYKCYNIRDVYCYAREVPNAQDAFSDPSYPGVTYIKFATLHVPYSSYNSYCIEKPWWEFGSIVRLPQESFRLDFYVDEELYKQYDVLEGNNTILESFPTKEGYTFSGWTGLPAIMPPHDVTATGTFNINSYKLTYMIGEDVYKETIYEYGATIVPEAVPSGDYVFFTWMELPSTMPAHDVIVYANFETGILDISTANSLHKSIFSLNGRKLSEPIKGVNIMVDNKGTKHKIILR